MFLLPLLVGLRDFSLLYTVGAVSSQPPARLGNEKLVLGKIARICAEMKREKHALA
jgi:hypothetical protein